jgi:hypothetical protein
MNLQFNKLFKIFLILNKLIHKNHKFYTMMMFFSV